MAVNPHGELGLRIRLQGAEEARARLAALDGNLDAAQEDAVNVATTAIQGRIKRNLAGVPGYPQWRTGRLSRAIATVPASRGGSGWSGAVGVLATAPYGEILEFGGQIPEHVILPRIKRALAWPATEGARGFFNVQLGLRATPKQAQSRTRRAFGGEFAFAKRVISPARTQRAIPYLQPSLDQETGHVAQIFRSRIDAALRRKS